MGIMHKKAINNTVVESLSILTIKISLTKCDRANKYEDMKLRDIEGK